MYLGSIAKAASADTYHQLNLVGEVFERVRADYVEKPDDGKLVESAINGMLAGLDPHSSYMDPKGLRDMQVQTRGGIRRSRHGGHYGGWPRSRWWRRSTRCRRPSQGRRHGQRHHHPSRRRGGAGPHARPGRREDARPGEHQDQAQDHAQGRRQADRGDDRARRSTRVHSVRFA